jgi:DNA-directed RNA polymerase specialized sigma24 family protein
MVKGSLIRASPLKNAGRFFHLLTQPLMEEESIIISRLRRRDLDALTRLVYELGEDLVILAFTKVNDPQRAEDIICNVFLTLWMESKTQNLQPPIRPYLFKLVEQECELTTI